MPDARWIPAQWAAVNTVCSFYIHIGCAQCKLLVLMLYTYGTCKLVVLMLYTYRTCPVQRFRARTNPGGAAGREGVSSESQGRTLALTVLYVPYSLDSGTFSQLRIKVSGSQGSGWTRMRRKPRHSSTAPRTLVYPRTTLDPLSSGLSWSILLNLSGVPFDFAVKTYILCL